MGQRHLKEVGIESTNPLAELTVYKTGGSTEARLRSCDIKITVPKYHRGTRRSSGVTVNASCYRVNESPSMLPWEGHHHARKRQGRHQACQRLARRARPGIRCQMVLRRKIAVDIDHQVGGSARKHVYVPIGSRCHNGRASHHPAIRGVQRGCQR
jgi:hypothetical protein